jgi:hypothetical protein
MKPAQTDLVNFVVILTRYIDCNLGMIFTCVKMQKVVAELFFDTEFA